MEGKLFSDIERNFPDMKEAKLKGFVFETGLVKF